MNLPYPFTSTDDRAVSPVIGVILMVAITVILAAVIGAFVLGLGDQIQQTTPQASFSFDYNSTGDELTITHDGGQSIDAEELYIMGHDGGEEDWTQISGSGLTSDDQARAGTSVTVNVSTLDSGDTVRVVWRSQGDDLSSTLARFTIP
ncbi:MAG: type IV pilin [Natronomonas sp.]